MNLANLLKICSNEEIGETSHIKLHLHMIVVN